MPPKDRVKFVSNLDKRTDWTLKPWPTGAMPLQIANRFHEWVEQLCCDIRNDEFLLALCKQWRETIPRNPAWMIMHFQFAEPSLQLLEAIRTAPPDRPVAKELFQKCCLITDESMGRLEKYHGIYAQYQWVETPDGFEHRIYIGKGAAKHTSLSTSHTANTSGHMGILQRVLSYNSERQKRPKDNARPHYKYMLNLQPAGTRVIQEYWIVLFAATALDNITISYGVRTEETDAVQTLFQPRSGDFQQQEYGVDATTKGLVDAQWQYLETLAMVACGINTIDAPRGHGKTIARGLSSLANRDIFPSASTTFAVLKQNLPSNPAVRTCNLQTPTLEKPCRTMNLEEFQNGCNAILAFRPSRTVSVPGTVACAALPPPTGLSLGFSTVMPLVDISPRRVREIWTKYCSSSALVKVNLNSFYQLVLLDCEHVHGLFNPIQQATAFQYHNNKDPNPLFQPQQSIKLGSRHISLPFETTTSLTAYVGFQIYDLDEYGLVRGDLRGLIIWLADKDRVLLKALARIDRDKTSEFPMAPDDVRTFKIVGNMLRVFSWVLRSNKLFDVSDGPFYNSALSFPRPSLDLAASLLSFSSISVNPAIGDDPVFKGLDPIWKKVSEGINLNENELFLRAQERAWESAPFLVKFEDALQREKTALARVDWGHPIDLQQTAERHSTEPDREHSWVSLQYHTLCPPQPASLTLVNRAQRLARDESTHGHHLLPVLQWISNQSFLGMIPQLEPPIRELSDVYCFDRAFIPYMGHLGEARFAAIIDNVLVRFTLGRKEVSKRIYGCELASMMVEQVDSLMGHIVQKITRLIHDLQESMTSTNEQVTFEYSRIEPLDNCQAKIIQPWTGQGEKELDVYADYIHIVYY